MKIAVKTTRSAKNIVKRGDNLGLIANKYDVAVAEIKKWNGLRGNTIAYGKFKIITTETVVQTVKKRLRQHLPSVDVKVVKAVKITKEVRTDTLAANTATVYIVQKG
jgi:membrane-bound lytic murein transglycosylase D